MQAVIAPAESEVSAAHSNTPHRRTQVLFLIDSLWGIGGAEACLLRLTQSLDPDRFQCRVITFHANDASRPFLDQFPCPVMFWRLNNTYDRNALKVAWRLRRLVRDQNIDIVHTFFQTSDLWAGPLARLSGARALISSRRDMGFLRKKHHRIGYRLLRRVYDQVQVVSNGVKQFTIEADGVLPSRIRTVYNGIDPNIGAPASEVETLYRSLNLPPGALVVTSVANFRAVKGIDVLVRAAAIVGKKIPNVRFVVAGRFGESAADRGYTASVKSLVHELGADQVVQFLGLSKQVPALLKLSDVFTLSSRSEGMSNALLEAMASGIPCVATAVGGNPEVIAEGKTGFLVPSEDAEQLADRLLRLLNDPLLRKRMGAASRQRILDHFTLDRMSATVMSAYEELLDGKCER